MQNPKVISYFLIDKNLELQKKTLFILYWDIMFTLSRVQLWDPMKCSLPASSVHGIFQARVLEWGAISS